MRDLYLTKFWGFYVERPSGRANESFCPVRLSLVSFSRSSTSVAISELATLITFYMAI